MRKEKEKGQRAAWSKWKWATCFLRPCYWGRLGGIFQMLTSFRFPSGSMHLGSASKSSLVGHFSPLHSALNWPSPSASSQVQVCEIPSTAQLGKHFKGSFPKQETRLFHTSPACWYYDHFGFNYQNWPDLFKNTIFVRARSSMPPVTTGYTSCF